MIVIEDVDLIARARETMYGPCDENILNKLLNEMDGLCEDAVFERLSRDLWPSLYTARNPTKRCSGLSVLASACWLWWASALRF